jgi:NAD(P)-dependent dehydrogenase (short-subunit alcohol dehydrogenase family)
MSTWLITGCSTGLGRALAEAVASIQRGLRTPKGSGDRWVARDSWAKNWATGKSH